MKGRTSTHTPTFCVQGDHGGLTLGFVDFDLVCSSFCTIMIEEVKIGQRWHFVTPKLKSTKFSVKSPWSSCRHTTVIGNNREKDKLTRYVEILNGIPEDFFRGPM